MKNFVILLLTFCFSNVYSQYSIKGKVKDISAVAIENARVTLFNSDTTIFFERRTTAIGKYTFNNVASGNYTLGVAAIGKEYEEIPLLVSVSISALNFTLADESQKGSWEVIVQSPEALGGTNLGVLLPDGEIFYCHNTTDPFKFDPVTNETILINGDDDVQGCVGPVLLPDGKVIFIGGADQDFYGPGTRLVKVYDPVNDTWQDHPNMLDYRWYPTVAQLPDNKILIAGGGGLNNPVRTNTSEIYDPAAGTSQWVDNIAIGNEVSPVILLYNGKVLMTHRPPQLFDPATNQWNLADDFVQGNRMANGDHADHELVLLPDGRAVAVGFKSFTSNPGTMIEFYDPTLDSWSLGNNFSPVRSRAKTVLTPNKKIFVMAGYKEETADPTPTNQYGYMKITDQYDPYSGTWRRLAAMNYSREYHAITTLVPDGRIIAVGGEGAPGNEPSFSVIEAFTPPYLLRGVRPIVKNLSSTELARGVVVTFKVSRTKSPTSVILMSNALNTHFMNSGNNRYLELAFTKSGSQITTILPSDAVTMPDGYYMLFVMVDDIPSVGKIVHVQGSAMKPGNELPIFTNDFSIFPNPASQLVTVNYSLHEEQEVAVSITDLAGKRMASWSLGKQVTGNHFQNLNLKDLNSGLYLLSLTIGEKEKRSKLVIE
ncbi:MAG: galactose oxidase-like domain-containing protein [Chitinophagales bacterium]